MNVKDRIWDELQWNGMEWKGMELGCERWIVSSICSVKPQETIVCVRVSVVYSHVKLN